MIDRADPKGLGRDAFVARFAHVFEHSPWIAEAAFDAGLPDDAGTAAGLHRAFCAVLGVAPEDRKRALINAHPDLAGRLARAGTLTAESTQEQTSAGLDSLSEAEFRHFSELNEAYKKRFAFPFIMAVKGQGKDRILAAFEARLHNDPQTEFQTALEQIERIALLRLKDLLP